MTAATTTATTTTTPPPPASPPAQPPPHPAPPPPQPPLTSTSADQIASPPSPPPSAQPPSPMLAANLPRTTRAIREQDLAAFVQLVSRFHVRVEQAASGRKFRPLRDAFAAALTELRRYSDAVDVHAVAEKVVDALRLGCESGKIVIVDACLDCIHRLFEYAHFGPSHNSTQLVLEEREGTLDEVVAIVCSCLEVKDEDVFLRMVQTLLTASTHAHTGLHERTLLAAVRTIYNIYLNARQPGTRTTARVALAQILNLVFTRMETESAAHSASHPDDASSLSLPSLHTTTTDVAVDVPHTDAPPDENVANVDDPAALASVLEKDAYLLFRALCKLSAKEDVDTSAPDPVGMRSKLLSLHLLKNLISTSGPTFRKGDRFIYALRQYLAPSLLVNCMWNNPEVMDLSFDIFQMLLRNDAMRPLLKTEIGAIFDTVIFRFLESPTAGPVRKRRAVKLFTDLSADRQCMADLFLNYDCDMGSANIFERFVTLVSTAAQEKPPRTPTNQPNVPPTAAASTNELEMNVMALKSVVQVVRSLREWSKPIEDGNGLFDYLGDVAPSIGSASPDGKINGNALSKSLPGDSSPVGNADEYDESPTAVDGSQPVAMLQISPSNSTIVGVVSEQSDSDTNRFEAALKAKQDAAEGVRMFNTKPKRGIEFLVMRGRLQKEPMAIAEYLDKAEGIDASVLGEYLGDGDKFNIKVMHAFTDMVDLTDITFDAALRTHLGRFGLPGEAQKIERIMEKFASRYCECNPDVFANADTAFVLAYSLIMLHTDAHNTTIKHKMTKDEFVRNNRGINDGADLDRAFLEGLYNRITTSEIRLAGSKSAKERKALYSGNTDATLDPTQKARQFERESRLLMAQTKILFKKNRSPAQDYTYYTATNVHHARLMFDRAWFSVLAAISRNLEESRPSDVTIVSFCLDGFRNCIALSSTFGMSTAKDAFVSSLAKFTHLNSISEMRPKNVECVRMILAIAALEGNNLGEQWIVIVRAISQLEQIRAVASGNPSKYHMQKSHLAPNGNATTSPRISSPMSGNSFKRAAKSSPDLMNSKGPALSRTSTNAKKNVSVDSFGADRNSHEIDPRTATMATTIEEGEIERIFTNSCDMPASDIADFCAALCSVALQELDEKPVPRIFCLQKIVEIAYYNMDSRTRIEWGKLWAQMGPFFGDAMCHRNIHVAMYATDALRQLASKFLEKDELSNFSFQRAFLKPFEASFSRSKSIQVRELVLQCISQIVLARAGNIKSGWKSVFGVLALAAEDGVDAIMNFGWQVVESISKKYIGVMDDVFVEAVTGIAAYTKTRSSAQISLLAIDMLSGLCASSLANGLALSILREQQQSPKQGDSIESAPVLFSAENDAHTGAWFPILTGLASAMQDDREQVRQAANEALFTVLSNHGGRFSSSLWAIVFRGVIAPIFDDIRHITPSNRAETAAISDWVKKTGAQSLKALVDVFVRHFAMTKVLLPELINLIQSWIIQNSETVAREGIGVLARFIMIAGEILEAEQWNMIITKIAQLFDDTMPHEILGPADNSADNDEEENESLEAPIVDSLEDDSEIIERQSPIKKISTNNSLLADHDSLPPEDFGDGHRMDFRVVRSKCVVQLRLVTLVQDIVVTFYRNLRTEQIMEMSCCLEKSYLFAHDFNVDVELRYSLWRSGFMNQVPNLLNQETSSLMGHLRIMFWLYLDPSRGELESTTEDVVVGMCEKVLRDYIRTCDEANAKAEERREVGALSPVVSFIVRGMMQMSEAQFEKLLPALYGILLDVLDCANDALVRRNITRLFRKRITGSIRKMDAEDEDIGKPQLPGPLRERLVHVSVKGDTEVIPAQEISNALNRAGGVRLVTELSEPLMFRVVASSPDEMLSSSVLALSFVRGVIVNSSQDG